MALHEYHVVIDKETTFGTYATATAVGVPLDSAEAVPNVATPQGRHTGAKRSLKHQWSTTIAPSFTLSGVFWKEYMGRILRAAGFSDITSTVLSVGDAVGHAFLADDDAASPPSLSLEVQHTGTAAQFLRGAVIDTLDIEIDGEEAIMFNADGVALDFVRASGTWGDGTSAPAVSTPAYFANTVLPFFSYMMSVTLNPTVTLTGGRLVPASGSAIATLENLGLSISNSAEQVKGQNGTKAQTNVHLGSRDIELSFDLDFSTVDNTWQDALLAGTVIKLAFKAEAEEIDNGDLYTFEVVVPRFIVTEANYPEANGSNDRPVVSVTGVATEGDDGYDIGFYLINTDTGY